MKQIVFIPLLFICFTVKALTTTLPATLDTTVPKTSLKKAAMLNEFGNNDTCRALIEYWYGRRNFFGIASAVSGAGVAGSALWLFGETNDNNTGNNNNNSWAQSLADSLFFVLTFWVGLILLAILLPIHFFHPRRKLLRLLTNFRTTGNLPEKYLNKIKFRLEQNSK